MPARAWALLLVLSVLWGGSFLFTKLAVAEVPPFTMVLTRLVIGAALLLVLLRFSGERLPRDRQGIVDLAVLGLLANAIPFVLIAYGQTVIGVGLGSILNATTPIFAVVFAHLLTTDDKATPAKVAGVMIGVLGVAILVGFDDFGMLVRDLRAELACLAASMTYGLASVWSRRFRGRPPMVTAAGQLIASSTMLLPVTLVVDAPWTLPWPSTRALFALLGLAVLSTALAYVIFFRVITLAGASSATLVTILVPPSAILMGVVFLDERLAPQHLAGMAVIAIGLLAIDGRLVRSIAAATARKETGGP